MTHIQRPSLLIQSQSNRCLLQSIRQLEPHCQHLDDSTKRNITVRFSNCVLEAAGRRPIVCQSKASCFESMPQYQWTIYSSYIVHIDNLCHYYQQIDWEERAMRLANRLLQSSINTSLTVDKTLQTSKTIINSHHKLQTQLTQNIKFQEDANSQLQASQALHAEYQAQLISQLATIKGRFQQQAEEIITIVSKLTYFSNGICTLFVFKSDWVSVLMYYFVVGGVLLVVDIMGGGAKRHYLLAVLMLQLIAEKTLQLWDLYQLAILVRLAISSMLLCKLFINLTTPPSTQHHPIPQHTLRSQLSDQLRTSRLYRILHKKLQK